MLRYLCSLLLLLTTACSGISTKKFDSYNDLGTVDLTFKTVEIYESSWFLPSYQYTLIYECTEAGVQCKRLAQTPNVVPGLVPGIIAPAIQAGAIVGAGALIGDGIRNAKPSSSSNIVNNGSSSSSGSSANSSSSSTNTNTNTLSGSGGCVGNCK